MKKIQNDYCRVAKIVDCPKNLPILFNIFCPQYKSYQTIMKVYFDQFCTCPTPITELLCNWNDN